MVDVAIEDDRVFYDVRHPEKTIVIALANEHYAKLIVEVADPDATVRMLRDYLARRQQTAF